MLLKKYTLKGNLQQAGEELKRKFPGWQECRWFQVDQSVHRNCPKIHVFGKYWRSDCRKKFTTLYIPVWSPECGKRKKYLLIDRENDCQIVKINMRTIVDHFIGDGTSCVNWHKGNIDFNRFRQEMAEIGYVFVISF